MGEKKSLLEALKRYEKQEDVRKILSKKTAFFVVVVPAKNKQKQL